MGLLSFLKWTPPLPKIIEGKIIGIEKWGDYEILVTFEDGQTSILHFKHTTAVKHYLGKSVKMAVNYGDLENITEIQLEFLTKEEQ